MKTGQTVHGRREAGAPPRVLTELLVALFAGVVAILAAGYFLQIWHMRLQVPIYPAGDALFTQMVLHTVVDHGWVTTNESIGAPFGSSLQDLSVVYGDATQLLMTSVLSLLSSSPAAILNVLYIGGYGLIAAAAYLAIRGLGLPRAAALVAGILFALTRYHFARAEGHLFLGLFYAVPAMCWLLYGVLGNHDLVRRREGVDGWRAWLSRRTFLTIGLAVVVGTSEVYYAVFGLILLAMLLVFVGLLGERRRAVIAIGLMGVIAFSTIAVQAPSLAYKSEHGKNTTVSVRSPTESDAYGMRLSDMIIPDRYHRFGPFASLGRQYFDANGRDQEERYSGLDTLGTIGLIAGFLTLLAAATGRLPKTHAGQLLRDSGLLALMAYLVGTVGGFGGIFAYLVSPTVRGWNRIAIVVAFFSLVAMAALLTMAMQSLRSADRPAWLRSGRRPALAAGGLAVLATLFGMWDQTSPALRPNYEGVLAQWRADARFVSEIDRRLPADAMVLQLPYAPFPENGPTLNMADYDQLFGYAHSTDLRWSYGAIKGRSPEDWGVGLEQLSPADLVRRATAAGFSGVTIDRYGYEDAPAKTLIEGISKIAGQTPVESADERRVYIDLTGFAAAQRDATSPQDLEKLRRSLLYPTVIRYGAGFLPAETDGTTAWHWAGPTGAVEISRPSARTSTEIAFTVRTPGAKASKVKVTAGGKPLATITVPPGKPTKARFTLPANAAGFDLATDAPDETSDERELHMQIIDLTASTP